MQQLPPALAPLAALKQFCIYHVTPDPARPGKTNKKTVHPTGLYPIDHGDPQHWLDAQTACDIATRLGPSYGVGFSVQRGNNLFFVDLDSHWHEETITPAGELIPAGWSPLALELMRQFNGAYMEVSRSTTGVHILGVGVAPDHGCVNKGAGLEFYTEGRFCALTGTGATGNIASDHTAALHHLTQYFFPSGGEGSAGEGFELTTTPVPHWRGPTDDDELIRRALESRSAAATFGAGASFKDLWERNVEVLAQAFPDEGRIYNESSADAALAAHLCFWTGRHGERIRDIMRRPDCMLRRDKWDRGDGEEFLARTISRIMAKNPDGDVLQDKPPEVPTSVPLPTFGAPEQRVVSGSVFMNLEGQVNLFRGCVYVTDAHKVLTPGGKMLTQHQFNVAFGGFIFQLDDINSKTERKAWNAFTESQILRCEQVDTTCFRPDLAPGTIVKTQGRSAVNTWWAPLIDRTPGDVSPFINHLRKLLPDERDQKIILSYMAACVQHKGKKFPWMPVIQGTQGNGKTLLSLCVAQAIGAQYVFWPKIKSLESQFNKWLGNTIFVGIEELKSRDHQDEVIQNLLTMITGDMGIQVEGKGVDAISIDICCNLMATTNHRDSVRKTVDVRRFCMFFTAQQTWEDVVRDGMDGDYFPDLYDWLKKRGGFAIVSELLHTYPIEDDFNPAGAMHRAPDTSTTNTAIVETRGGIEQQIMEAVEQGTNVGFMGGWISSYFLDQLLTGLRHSRITLQQRMNIMKDLGYIPHPGLNGGRVGVPVLPDNKRSVLFVRRGSPESQLTLPQLIAKKYTEAQSLSAPVKLP